MNGVVEITIEGNKHTLMFGVQACMIFQDLAVQNALDPNSKANEIKLISELFYSGLAGYAIRSRKQSPSFEAAMDLFDKFSLEENFIVEHAEIWNTWRESKWGSSLIANGEEALKKKAELESQT